MTGHPALTWNLLGREPSEIALAMGEGSTWLTPDWAWGGSSGAGVQVCVVDSGIEPDHPLIGETSSSHAVMTTDGETTVVAVEPEDLCGHGTACASIIRRIAPECGLHSVRILGANGTGTADALVAGLRWAVRQRFDVINLSLSTPRTQFKPALRDLADEAFFAGSAIVASAHNAKIESFPWRFSSVISVGSHGEEEPSSVFYNPAPPVEFFAKGQAVIAAGLGGATTKTTGNSFATPHVTGLCALIRSKHPQVTVFELKTILYLTSANVRSA
jgi:subtilisin